MKSLNSMDKKVISELLEKYFDGSSSLQEEETLKRAFSEDESLIKDFPEGAVFYYLKAEEKVKGNVDLPDLKVRSFWSASSYRWAATLLLGIGLYPQHYFYGYCATDTKGVGSITG